MSCCALALALVGAICAIATAKDRPHIVLIIADDLGWNDVSFHGSNQIPTANIDALAYAGIVLQNYYVAPICTPSRASLMTGKYGIHTGMQHGVIYGMEPRGLPLTEKILPQYLKELGYKTHLVGKWHLGSYRKEYLPCNRGFDSHTGFLTGKIDMYDHTNMEHGTWGFDFRKDGKLIDHNAFGKYATDIFSDEAVKIISNHNKSLPLFLTIAHSAVHSGNSYEYIRAPEPVVQKFNYIIERQRQKYAGVVWKLDESVGAVVRALQAHGLLENSIVLFTTDNGGAAAGFNSNAASNYPLRGVKNTLWEGGVRGAAAMFSPLLKKRARVATQRMHLVDWLPTLYGAAGGNISALGTIDGIDQWKALSEDLVSERTTVLHNIDDIWGSSAITVDKWKLVKGTNYNGSWDSWYGPRGRSGSYAPSAVLDSRAGAAFSKLGLMPDEKIILDIREAATLKCSRSDNTLPCNPLKAPCLFNIEEDPCELTDLASQQPETLARLLGALEAANRTARPPNNRPDDPRGNPLYWGRLFFNFDDFLHAK